MSKETIDLAAQRIGEHARRHRLSRVTVILHGGEPLLAGHETIDHAAAAVRAAVPEHTTVALHIQTNGLLIDGEFLELFDRHNIRVGVSLDGGEEANDRSRRYAGGGGSYQGVVGRLDMLRNERYRHLYSGLLCTVDIRNDPLAVYESLLRFEPPRVDFLLPHGNWNSPPPYYDPAGDDTPYADWLIRVFDRWYDTPRRTTDVRLFSSILGLLNGWASTSEALGLDPVDLLVIETDGSIEQGDALKTVADGASATGMALATHTFDDALTHPGIRARQLGLEALSPQCRSCAIVAVCGGGLYAHRYRADNGHANPTVYCRDQIKLINHVRGRYEQRLRTVFGSGRSEVRTEPPAAYRFTGAQFDGLASGYGDESTVELLRSSQASKRRLLLLAVVRAAVNTSEWTEWSLPDAWTLLEAATTAGGSEVSDEVLHHPFVDAWAVSCLRALRAPSRSARPELSYLPAMAVAAGLRCGMDFELAVPVPDGQLAVPGLGLAEGLGSGLAKVTGDGEALTIVGPERTVTVPAPYTVDGQWWYPRRLVTADSAAGPLTVAIDDLDPYRSCFRLPLDDRLSGAATRALGETFGVAWRLIGTHHRRHAEAMRGALRALVPLRPPARGAVSAAARTAFGAIATSTPLSADELALQLVHETQHMKLGALLDLVALYDRADTTVHHAPWRADPRPVGALLQGVYAHLGVADYWRELWHRSSGHEGRAAEVEYTYWLEQTSRAAGTLMRSGSLTEHGERFVGRLMDTMDGWRREAPVGSRIALGASDLVHAGTVRWRLSNLRPSADEVRRVVDARRRGMPCPPIVEVPSAQPAPQGPAVLDGLAARIRSHLTDPDPAASGGPQGDNTATPANGAAAGDDAAQSAYLGGDFGTATERYCHAVAAQPDATEPWIGLALAAGRAGMSPAARALGERPDLIRAVYVELREQDAACAPDELAGWLATGLSQPLTATADPGRSPAGPCS